MDYPGSQLNVVGNRSISVRSKNCAMNSGIAILPTAAALLVAGLWLAPAFVQRQYNSMMRRWHDMETNRRPSEPAEFLFSRDDGGDIWEWIDQPRYPQ